ncbi:MAG: DUF1587 domain-containing protein, partial [Armatimonadetes bacterium]|nr:DUF1587 domain-containing protein [Armatimonadota bacterium]
MSNPRCFTQSPVLGLTLALMVLTGLVTAGASPAAPADRTRQELERTFQSSVRPLLNSYCISCHGRTRPQAQLDLTVFRSAAEAIAEYPRWALIHERLAAHEMPPKTARQPPARARAAVLAWVTAVRRYEATRNAGDPGPVSARRLSNAEYDYTIRDLTGVDLRPTREFPVDPANQEGFDNSGESLTLSPSLMKNLQAARQVADHLVLKPDGFDFAAHPVLVETDRDKYSILRIVEFYKRQPTDYADYFLAAWRFRHAAVPGKPATTLARVAADARLSPAYLSRIWELLNAPGYSVGPIHRLQAMWNALPAPDPARPDAAGAGCVAMREYVAATRKNLAWRFENLSLPGFSAGGQCFIMWKNIQYAAHRRSLDPATLQIGGVPKPRPLSARPGNRRRQEMPPPEPKPDPELFVPAAEGEREPYLASFRRFCDVFPDAFFVSERGRMHIEDPNDRGRLLSAGFHNMMGYFRDDTPLMELILDDAGRRELNRLWQEFDFVAFVPERMHLEFIFYERAESGTIRSPEFDFARSEDRDATSEAKIARLRDVYLEKARKSREASGSDPITIRAIEDHFSRTSATVRAIEKVRAEAEPRHLERLLDLARRAYRRPLTEAERSDLTGFYRSLRDREGLSHEDALRDLVVAVLMSPHFLFRLDLEAASPARPPAFRTVSAPAPGAGPPAPAAVRPLPDYALASRLSYFLWSSLPDEELLQQAASGALRRPEGLLAQTRRLLKDPRA